MVRQHRALNSFGRALAAGIVVSGWALVAAAQPLPGEAVLPGDRATPAPPPANLPGEALLPGERARPAVVAGLPDESQLPPGADVAVGRPTTIEVLLAAADLAQADDGAEPPVVPPPDAADAPLGRPLVGQPWLRFATAGHTAPVRVLAFTRDGARLLSAGEDKIAQVWSRPPAAVGAAPTWVHERTLRWQVQRGPRGRIYALAVGPDTVAIAGHGAMGMLGEIVLLDPATGQYRQALTNDNGHRQVVAALSFSPSGQRLASLDVAGQAALWTRDAATGQWAFRQLTAPDSETYGAATAQRLAASRRAAPIVIAGEDAVILPQFVEFRPVAGRPEGIAVWRLVRLAGEGPPQPLGEAAHFDMVTALAASADGQRLVSADAAGQVYFWRLGAGAPPPHREQLAAAAVSACFAADNVRVAIGTAQSPRLEGQSLLQVWNMAGAAPARVTERRVADHVYALASAAQGERFVFSQGARVIETSFADVVQASPLADAPIGPVFRVGFARERPFHRIALSRTRQADGSTPFDETFDPGALALGRGAAINQADWLTGDTWRSGWSVRIERNAAGVVQPWFYRGDERIARLPLRPERHGLPTTVAWLPNRQGQTAYAAVGTDGSNNIFVYKLEAGDTAPLARQFRGHGAAVTSLAVSRDLRYLVSASQEGIVSFWPLRGVDENNLLLNRWGVGVDVEEGELRVTTIRPDGPLHFRGVRAGDVLTALAYVADGQVQHVADPAAIRARLLDTPFDTLVAFEYSRGRVAQEAFQLYPAWQPLVSLAVANDREWAYWTPAGFYDASMNGHRLFGWQFNRGLDLPPEFFLAAQFREQLEQPDVLEKILTAGSLEEAFKMAAAEPPREPQHVVAGQWRTAPRVTIETPTDGVAEGVTLTIRAAIGVRDGQRLEEPKAFAAGVPAVERRLVAERPTAGGVEYVYEWDARLPSEPQIPVQVVAATAGGASDVQATVVDRSAVPPPAGRPRLWILAAGVGRYADAQIGNLDFPALNARAIAATLQAGAGGLYNAEAIVLADEAVTRPLWRVVAGELAERLRSEAGPDDLLVLFLSGHGVRDESTGAYYFAPANARLADIQAGRFGDCLSLDDLAAFGDAPCRKLVVLDTCHSGAVTSSVVGRPLGPRDYKAALRLLEGDLMFTLTASEGHELASEDRARGLGRFTAHLRDALAGAADLPAQGGDGDGRVQLVEAIRYVRAQVEAESLRAGERQTPTVAPSELAERVRLPLTAPGGVVGSE